MNFKPTQSGGRIAQGNTAFGDYRVEWDANGKLVSESIEIKSPPQPSRGLGDTIKKVTDALGIPQCPKCPKRQDKLNKAIPYNDG